MAGPTSARGIFVAVTLLSTVMCDGWGSPLTAQDPFRPLRQATTGEPTSDGSVDAVAADGTTALHRAAVRDHLAGVEGLLAAGADVNAANDLGATALWVASVNGSEAVVRALLQAGADPDLALRHGETPLMAASRAGSATVVALLLDAGADPERRGPRDQTALMWAAAERHSAVVEVLLDGGADVHARSQTRRVFMAQPPAPHPQHRGWFEHGGNTALMFAARAGDATSARHLVDAGADVDDRNAWGLTALTMAVYADFGPLLVRVSTEPVPFHIGGRETFATGQHPEVVELLLERGSDPNLGATVFTALHAAVMRRDDRIVDRLLEYGANPHLTLGTWTPQQRLSNTDYYFHRAWVGAPPVWLAARFGTPHALRQLVVYGADPDYIHRGEHYAGAPGGELSGLERDVGSPLMAAVGMSRTGRPWVYQDLDSEAHEAEVLEKVKLLVDLGVDVNAMNHEGRAALDGALENEYETVVELLRAAGARRGNGMPTG